MKGDFSRSSFRPEKNYSRVLMQQGRVQLDADWNEQLAILAHRDEIRTLDILGQSGAPEGNHGFEVYLRPGISFSPDPTAGSPAIRIDSPEMYAFSGDAEFTLEAWICPRQGGAVLSNAAPDSASGYALTVTEDGSVRFDRACDSHPVTAETRRPLPRNCYSHVAVVCSRHSIQLYISGELESAVHFDSPASRPEHSLLIGGRLSSDAPEISVFDGEIADVRIWQTARTVEELRTHSRELLPGHHPHLAGRYYFGAASRTIWDTSGNENHGGFVSSAPPAETDAPPGWVQRLWVRRGRYYVDGLLCECHEDTQIPLPAGISPESCRLLVWLDVWESEVNPVEDPQIREKALGGADTTIRAKVFWKIRFLPVTEAEAGKHEPAEDLPSWREMMRRRRSVPAMRAQAERHDGLLGNNFYRVEICSPGGDTPPSFLWSRDNGSVVYPVYDFPSADRVRLGPAAAHELPVPGSWVELSSEARAHSDTLPLLVRVKRVDPFERILTFDQPLKALPEGRHCFLRVWNQKGDAGAVPIGPGWIHLERGIQVQFPVQQNYRTGDYWLLPTRTADAELEWPRDDQGPRPVPASRAQVHACALALLGGQYGRLVVRHSCRRSFFPLTSVAAAEHLFVRKSGDAMTGDLKIGGELTVDKKAVFSGDLHAAHISGRLAHHMVDTPQLVDRSVTREKLAFDIPESVGGFTLFRNSPAPVPGYACVSRILTHNPSLTRRARNEARRVLQNAGGLRAVACAGHVFVVSEETGALRKLDPLTGHFEEKAQLAVPRRAFALAATHRHIYLIGGLLSYGDSEEATGEVFIYHLESDVWTEGRSLNHPRAHLAAAAHEGRIYAFGGERPGWLSPRRTAVCEVLDPASESPEWTDCGEMTAPRSRFGLISHDGCLYAIGGSEAYPGGFGSKIVGSVEKFYPQLIGGRDWSCLMRPMPAARSEVGVGVLEGQIFCGGGRRDGVLGLYSIRFTRDCQMYDPDLNQWTAAPPMPDARRWASVVATGNHVFAVGGDGPGSEEAPVLGLASFYFAYAEEEVRVGSA